MASRSSRNLISVPSLTEGCAILTEKQFPGLAPVCSRVKDACAAAHRSWPEQVTMSEANRLGRIMAEAEREALAGIPERENFVTYSSMCLGLLSDAMDAIKDPVRRSVLDRVHGAMMELHGVFDERLDSWSDYAMASRAIVTWAKRMAA